LPFQGEPGANNAITDVPGVLVGFATIDRERDGLSVGEGPVHSGVTAILPRGRRDALSPVWAGHFNLNGNGELTGTHWIHDAGYFTSPICLTNTHAVGIAHHATVKWMIRQYPAFRLDHAWAMPVIGETYDGLTSDICGMHVTEAHVFAALDSASAGPVEEGNVGGGTGMLTYEFKGGTGTASRLVDIGNRDYTVAALVQSNFGSRKDLTILGVPVGREWPQDAPLTAMSQPDTGSIIVIIGTDLPLLPQQLRRLAKRGAMGIARTGAPGGHYSGDIMLAFSVANDVGLPGLTAAEQPARYAMEYINDHFFDGIYDAVVQSVEEAIINALVAARPLPIIKPPGYSAVAIDHRRLQDLMRRFGRLA
jgi:D-aminopeptidase